jgi:5'-3' exonuclease
MLQLANDNLNIKILKPNKGNTYSIYTEKKIEEEYKIPFNNLINYMALVGDKVDDIKGIAGKVGAMKILNKYKSQKDLIESLQPDDKKIFELNLKLIDLKENENYINKLNLKKEIRTTIINKLKLFSNEEDIQKTFDWLNIKKFIAISFFVFRSKENYLKIIKSF